MGTLGASGDGGPRLTLLGSFQKLKIKTTKNRRLTGGCAAGDVNARNQEKSGISECPAGSRHEPNVATMADLAPPLPLRVQEPANGKRGRDLNDEIIWVSKKQRSSMALARERGKAITGRIRAAAVATSSLIVQESAGSKDSGDPICKNFHHLQGGDIGVVLDEKKKVKLRPCVFVAPVRVLDGLVRDCEVTQVTVLDMGFPSRHVKKPVAHDFHNNDKEACCLIKRSHAATVADCEGGSGAVDNLNRAMPSRTKETTSRRYPMQEAKAAGCHGHKINSHSAPKTNNGSARKTNNRSARKTNHRSACRTPMRPFMSLSSGLQCLGVADARPVIEKTLTATDSNPDQSRLQFSPREVMESPLITILTEEEWQSVHKAGLLLEVIDRHGYLYNMRFKYLESTGQYRLVQEWVPFLIQNCVREGHLVQVGAFRVDGRPMLTLLNYAKEGWIPEETEAAEGLLMLSDCNNGSKA